MSEALLDELRRENLCTHFILPLLKLNKFSFASAGFINTFITRDLDTLAVQVSDTVLLPHQVLRLHPAYIGTYQHKDGYYYVMLKLDRWQRDVHLFCEGKYSLLSDKAKRYILRYSGLPNQEREGKKIVTDGRLLALTKHDALKQMWITRLFSEKDQNVAENHLPDEFLSSPGDESFIEALDRELTRIRDTQY